MAANGMPSWPDAYAAHEDIHNTHPDWIKGDAEDRKRRHILIWTSGFLVPLR
jgi:hypothetical protein